MSGQISDSDRSVGQKAGTHARSSQVADREPSPGQISDSDRSTGQTLGTHARLSRGAGSEPSSGPELRFSHSTTGQNFSSGQSAGQAQKPANANANADNSQQTFSVGRNLGQNSGSDRGERGGQNSGSDRGERGGQNSGSDRGERGGQNSGSDRGERPAAQDEYKIDAGQMLGLGDRSSGQQSAGSGLVHGHVAMEAMNWEAWSVQQVCGFLREFCADMCSLFCLSCVGMFLGCVLCAASLWVFA